MFLFISSISFLATLIYCSLSLSLSAAADASFSAYSFLFCASWAAFAFASYSIFSFSIYSCFSYFSLISSWILTYSSAVLFFLNLFTSMYVHSFLRSSGLNSRNYLPTPLITSAAILLNSTPAFSKSNVYLSRRFSSNSS